MIKQRKIYLVRHGELYEKDGIKRCLGRTDVPLTKLGEKQAQTVSKWFLDKNISKIYSSPYQRCTKTAQIIKDTLNRIGQTPDLSICDDLRELDAGKWENLSFEEIKNMYPEEYEARGRQIGYYAPPGGESFYQAGLRFKKCLDEIRKATNDNLLIVAHSGVIRGYLCHLLHISANEVFSLNQPFTGISIINETDDVLNVEKIGWLASME